MSWVTTPCLLIKRSDCIRTTLGTGWLDLQVPILTNKIRPSRSIVWSFVVLNTPARFRSLNAEKAIPAGNVNSSVALAANPLSSQSSKGYTEDYE